MHDYNDINDIIGKIVSVLKYFVFEETFTVTKLNK